MKKILIIVALVFIAVYVLLRSYFPDVEINRYDSFETVQTQKVMEKGWISKILPLSAYDIVETHDIDTNSVFGKFKYREKDEEEFLSNLKESKDIYESEKFIFKINREKNRVDFRNKILG
jgi:hypothetical protein